MTLGATTFAIDLSTLYVVSAFVAATLGSLLLLFGQQEGISALRWWGGAFLAGAVSIGTWAIGGDTIPQELMLALNMTGFVACGLVWTAARVFHGRPPHAMLATIGAVVWLVAGTLAADRPALRVVIGAAIVAIYAGLAAGELWRERRKTLRGRGRWAALIVPALHGMVLMLPILIGEWIEGDGGLSNMRGAWAVAFALQLVLYAIGTVIIIFMMVAERAVSVHKSAAVRDPLTGLLNRRGFAEACVRIADREAAAGRPVTVMVFDLDHFKGINDKFGHLVGDDILKTFAAVAGDMLRTTDVVGRIGGEEFAAFLPCSSDEAKIAAERVRSGFENCGVMALGVVVPTTVSIGMAGGAASLPFDHLLAGADKALYRAKASGRNRYQLARPEDFVNQRGRTAMPAPDEQPATAAPHGKRLIRMPQFFPTLNPETFHLPLKP